MKRIGPTTILLCIAVQGLAAQADERVVIGAGAFTVRNGPSTTAIQGGYYFSLEPDQFYEMGGELQYRTLRATVYGVPNVEITSFSIPGIIALKLVQKRVIPYAGLGVIFGWSTFDKSYVESRQPGLSVTGTTASSYGFLIVGGVRLHLESGLSFFGEYRYGWDSFSVELNGVRSSVEQGGSWILGGLGIQI